MRHGIIVTALAGELRPLVRGWTHTTRGGADLWQRPSAPGAGWTWTAACAGIGRAPALRALAAAEAAGGPARQIISAGFAGALSARHAPGETFEVSEVIDASTGDRFQCECRGAAGAVAGGADPGSPAFDVARAGVSAPGYSAGKRRMTAGGTRVVLATVDRIADAAEKVRLAADLQADLVDMEAAALAQIAQLRGVAFSCFKGISDGPTDRIPTNPSFVAPDGRLRYGPLIAHAVLHPSQWASLMRIGQNSGKAARGLKTALQAVMDDAS